MRVFFNNGYYCEVSSGQFDYGWDLYDNSGKLVAVSGELRRTAKAAQDDAFSSIPNN